MHLGLPWRGCWPQFVPATKQYQRLHITFTNESGNYIVFSMTLHEQGLIEGILPCALASELAGQNCLGGDLHAQV